MKARKIALGIDYIQVAMLVAMLVAVFLGQWLTTLGLVIADTAITLVDIWAGSGAFDDAEAKHAEGR